MRMFGTDLRRILAMWRSALALSVVVAMTAVLIGLPSLLLVGTCNTAHPPTCTTHASAWFGLLFLAVFPVAIFSVGLSGCERWWYGQLSVGQRPSATRLWTGSWWYFGRYFRLGLPASLAACRLSLSAPFG
jgi:hypothetical protein